jgi:outer membrane protein assembly factor BamA
MRPLTPLTAASLLALTVTATPALAQSFKIGKIEIKGVTSVPVQPLKDGLKERPGQSVTVNDVLADQEVLIKELESAHVTGKVSTALSGTPKNKDIIFTVTDTGIQKPVVTTTALHLAHLSFTGNQYMTADELAAATGLKPGDVITDQVLNDATQKIGAAYKKASDAKATLAGQTNVAVQYTYPTPGQVDITWTFTQTVKKKKRNTEDEGLKTE